MSSDRNQNETDVKLLEAYRQKIEADIPDLWDRISDEVEQLPPEEKKPGGTVHRFPRMKVWIPVAACILLLLIPLSLQLLRGGKMFKYSSSMSSESAQMNENVEESMDSSTAADSSSDADSYADTDRISASEESSAKQEVPSIEGLTITGKVEEIGENTVVLTVDSVAGEEASGSPVIEAGDRITIQYTGESPLDVQAGQQVSVQLEKEEGQIYFSQKIELLP